MVQFTIPQRKAYVKMLETVQEKVQERSRVSGYTEHKAEEEQLGAKFGLVPLQKRIEQLEARVKAEVDRRDEAFANAKRKQLKDVALAIGEVWSCETAEVAKGIVKRFVEVVQFPEE